jgi:hypothetical protein
VSKIRTPDSLICAYFFAAQQGLASSHFFASFEAEQGVLHDAAHGLASEVFASALSAQAAADGHLPQSFDTSVVAFFVSFGSLVEALATITITKATKTIPDNPIIIFLIL